MATKRKSKISDEEYYRLKDEKEKLEKHIAALRIIDMRAEVIKRADEMENGWIELSVGPDEENNFPAFTVKVPRIPFERWMRNTFMHRKDEWPNIAPMGMKMYMDDRDHTDWWLATGIPLKYAYSSGRRDSIDRNALYGYEPGDPGYVAPDPKAKEWSSMSERLDLASYEYRWATDSQRSRNSTFLVSYKKEIKGTLFHVKTEADIIKFVDECARWKNAFNSRIMIGVVPNCSVKYDAVIRHGGAIITQVGSAAAHLVKVAREDKVPVIMCPNAFDEFLHYEDVIINGKSISSAR